MSTLSRRDFIRVSTLATAATLAAACVQPSPTPEPTAAPAAGPAPSAPETRYQEAPELTQQVTTGALPFVDERLPTNPYVAEPFESVGKYGGKIRRMYRGLADPWTVLTMMTVQGIALRHAPGESLYTEPTFFESFAINEDATEWTFHMRPGVKWSDGEDCTTEDVSFWYNDVMMNTTLTPSISRNYRYENDPMQLEVLDAYNFVLTFSGPKPLLAAAGCATFCEPEHYLKQFHADYADADALEKVVSDNALDSWDQLWGRGPIAFRLLNPDLPVLDIWHMTVSPPADVLHAVRNPYYWAVDPEGQQLPYIGEIETEFFDSYEVYNMKVINGEIDWASGHPKSENYTLFKKNEERGGYRVIEWIGAATNTMYFNTNTPDPELNKLFNDVRFRTALSVAIDREEINEIVHAGRMEPRQASPISGSPSFDAEAESAWTEFDPEKANLWLDEVGLTDRDADGFRLRDDGEPISITVEFCGWGPPPEALQLITGYWGDVGIKMNFLDEDRSILGEHNNSYQIEIMCWVDDRNALPMANPLRYIGYDWCRAYYDWYVSDGANGYEPPEGHVIYEIWDAWERTQAEVDPEERERIFHRIIEIHKDNCWRLGTCGEEPIMGIVNANMANAPDALIRDTGMGGEMLGRPDQLYYKA